MRIGILGVGNLASYLVRGAQGGGHTFVLSPRGEERAADLAAQFSCEVAASNQAVAESCDHVLVCLPAAEGMAILRGMTFRAGQSVCSAMASLEDVRAAVHPAEGWLSMMPGYANAFSVGADAAVSARSGLGAVFRGLWADA